MDVRAPTPPPHLDEYVFAEKLGSGTYANVYKAYKKVTTNKKLFGRLKFKASHR